jgi:hypothetical protein
MLYKLSTLTTLYEWADNWCSIDFYQTCYFYLTQPRVYDVAFESYVHSWWNYLTEVAR